MSLSITRFNLCLFMLQMLLMHSVNAQSFALEAGDQNINLVYKIPVFYDANEPVVMNTHLLYSQQNDHQDLFASAGITALTTNTGLRGLSAGAGCRLVAADPLDYSLTAVALGGELIYQSRRSPEFRVETSLYHAATSLSFSDARNVSLITINIDYEIKRESFIRLGYRKITTQFNDGITIDFDRGIYLGLFWLY